MSIADILREANDLEELLGRKKPFPEQDIRYAEFLDWVREQPEEIQAAVTIAVQFTNAWSTKYVDPILGKAPSPHDASVLQSVEDACETLGLDLLREVK